MTVFKGYMILFKRNMGLIIMYLCIFLSLSIGVGQIQVGKGEGSYQSAKVDVAVINEDDSPLSEGLYKYLDSMHNMITVGNTEKDIQNTLFYRYAEYVVIIPKGYQDAFLKDKAMLKTTKLPGSESAQYVDAQLDTFLNSINVYCESGYSMEEAVSRSAKQFQTEGRLKMIDKNGNGGMKEGYAVFFQHFPYMIIAVLGYGIATILMRFRKKEIQRRMLCSSVSGLRQNLEGIGAFIVAGIGIWLFNVVALFVLYGKRFILSPNKWYFLLNSLVLLGASLALSFLIGVIIEKEIAMNAVVNILALGMCFLCGVFVPLEMLGKGVKNVSQFLPVYWYEVINEMLGEFNELSSAMMQTMKKGFAIQLIFAVACVCVALMVTRMKRQEEG